MSERRGRRTALLLAVLAVVPFLPGLAYDFTYDDKVIIRDNPNLASPALVSRIVATHYFGATQATGTAYRPVVLLTYAVQRWVHGNVPALFRAVNVALHAGVTVLLASWLLALGFPRGPSIAAAALFAVATIHVEAVTGLVGRAEVLAALLVLLGARLWLSATEAGRFRWGPFAGTLAAFGAAVFVKENAVVLPGVVFLGELFRGGSLAWPLRSLRARLRALWLPIVLLFLPVGLLFAARRLVLEVMLSREGGIFDLDNPLVALPPLVRAANAAFLQLRYVAKTFVPVGLSADHSAYALPMAARLGDPLALAGVGGLVLLAAAALVLVRSRPAFSFGVAFFLGTFLPTSNLIVPIGTIYGERLAYLPSAGLLLAACGLLTAPPRVVPRPSRVPWTFLVGVAAVVVYAGATVARARVFRDDRALYEDMVAKMPGSAKARYDLAFDAQRRGDLGTAKRLLGEANAIFPRYYEAWAVLGGIHRDEGRWDEAVDAFRRSVAILPSYEHGRFGLAKALEAAGRWEAADEAFRAGLAALPDSYPLRYHHAAFLHDRGRLREALAAWDRAVTTPSATAIARVGRARTLAALGRDADARAEARRAVAAEPALVAARLFLAERDEAAGRLVAAASELATAVRLSPGDASAAAALVELGLAHPELRGHVEAALPSITAGFGERPRDPRLAGALERYRGRVV